MTGNSRPSAPSPFHAGERQVQARLGVAEKVAAFGEKAVRDHLIDQHRALYSELPFLALGTIDDQQRPWASLVVNAPGFLSTPDDRTLKVAATPLPGDPLNATLKNGADVGVLGIQLETRRRNRMNGRLHDVGQQGFSIAVHQAFGNCPKYIQTRTVSATLAREAAGAPSPMINRSNTFDAEVRDLINRSDTFFIASTYSENADDMSHGADVSHRGGRPGFVRVEDDRTFIFPDFTGNNIYNTIGNLFLNPRAGILFVDFDAAGLVYMTGTTEIIWDGEDVDAFEGALRMIRFRADAVIHVKGSLPLEFRFGDYAPNLKKTGTWAHRRSTPAGN